MKRKNRAPHHQSPPLPMKIKPLRTPSNKNLKISEADEAKINILNKGHLTIKSPPEKKQAAARLRVGLELRVKLLQPRGLPRKD